MLTPFFRTPFDDMLGLRPYRPPRRNNWFLGLDLDTLSNLTSLDRVSAIAPSFEVVEDEENYYIKGTLGSLSPDAVKIDYDDEKRLLSIHAQSEVKREEKDEEGNSLAVYHSSSSFRRDFTLPEGVEKESIDASIQNGEIVISIPKPKVEEEKEEEKEPEKTSVPINFV